MTDMVTLEHIPVAPQPTYQFLFERAEHLLESLLYGLDRFPTEATIEDICDIQDRSIHLDQSLLDEACALKLLQQKVRAGRLLQPELVEDFERLSNPIIPSL